MSTIEQKQRILKAKVTVALYTVLGRVPNSKEQRQVAVLAHALCKAILELH